MFPYALVWMSHVLAHSVPQLMALVGGGEACSTFRQDSLLEVTRVEPSSASLLPHVSKRPPTAKNSTVPSLPWWTVNQKKSLPLGSCFYQVSETRKVTDTAHGRMSGRKTDELWWIMPAFGGGDVGHALYFQDGNKSWVEYRASLETM